MFFDEYIRLSCVLPIRLEEELNSMENTNTELKNVINTLNNERESLLEQVRQSFPHFLNILSMYSRAADKSKIITV